MALTDFWTASSDVQAEANAADFDPLAETVAGRVASARASVNATAIVRLPATATADDIALALHSGEAVGMTTREMASTTAQETAGEMADVASTLRHIENATMVTAADSAPPAILTVESPDALSSAIAELRTLPQFGTGALSAVTVTATAPSGTTGIVHGAGPGDPEADARARAAASQQLLSEVVRVTERLHDAGDTAGIRGAPSVAITVCETGTDEHVSGSVQLPILEITDSPTAPFDAIV